MMAPDSAPKYFRTIPVFGLPLNLLCSNEGAAGMKAS